MTVISNVDPDVDGGHLVGWRDVQLQGASGDRPAMRIYYPATAARPNAPVDAARGPYPVLAYGHGFRPPLLQRDIQFHGLPQFLKIRAIHCQRQGFTEKRIFDVVRNRLQGYQAHLAGFGGVPDDVVQNRVPGAVHRVEHPGQAF